MFGHVVLAVMLCCAEARFLPCLYNCDDDEVVPPPAVRHVDMGGAVVRHFEKAGGLLAEKSECLASAATALPDRCAGMSDVDYSRFAVALTNCHLAKSGRKTYVCGPVDSVERCTGRMDDAAFGAYTTIAVQVHTMCQQLQQEMRAIAADDAIAALTASTGATAEGVARLGANADRIAVAVADASRAQAAHFDMEIRRLDDIGTAAQRGLGSLQRIEEETAGVRRSVDDVAAAHAAFADRSLAAVGDVAGATAAVARSVGDLSASHAAFAEKSLNAIGGVAERAAEFAASHATYAERSLADIGGIAMATADAKTRLAGLADAQQNLAAVAGAGQRELLDLQRALAAEQRQMGEAHKEIMGSLAKLSWLQSAVFGEVLGLKAVVWYALAAALCILLTSATRTGGARLPVLSGLVATLFVERTVLRLVLDMSHDQATAMFACDSASGVCRTVFAVAAVAFVACTAVTHRSDSKLVREELEFCQAVISSKIEYLETLMNPR
jgi:hypothetical protein